MFEIVKRDGLARIGKFETKHGVLETPCLLPVINPKINTVPARELYEEFGFKALITNSYIIKNTPDLKEKAQALGLHEMLDYPGVIMTDSGTFQSHMYGEVEVTNDEMVEFQKSIGTDIGTVLDIFTEPFWTKEKTMEAIEETLVRTQHACDIKGEMMINGVVQGSVFNDLRTECAKRMASMDIDVHPIGGIVPLMEQYRYSELVDVVLSSKIGLNPNRPVHAFGAGHPMVLALLTLMGCDLFDSASYAKFARDDRMMFIDGTYRIQEMQSLDCSCPACRGYTLQTLRKLPNKERGKVLARHNLYQIRNEMNLVKRYLNEGRLWELAEMRCRGHPAMLDALRKLKEYQPFLEKYDPISRVGAMFYTGAETRNRPVFLRYHKRIMESYVPPTKKALVFKDEGSKPYSRAYAERFEMARKAGFTPVVISPFGAVPAELDEMYPLAQSVFPEISDVDTDTESQDLAVEFLSAKFEESVLDEDAELVPIDEGYDPDLERAKAVSRYQFGIAATDALFQGKVELVKSKKTGKIRNVISDGVHVLSMRAPDGMYSLKVEGADRIVKNVPAPHMRIKMTQDAVPFVSQGRNMFCQFVLECDENLVPGDEVILVDPEDNVVATGRLNVTADEIKCLKKGIAVKVRSGKGDDDE